MISIIVAIGKNNLIGKGNDLPWNYKSDLKYFKETTMGKKVVMGRNTFLSIINRIKTPLPGRENIVVTHDNNFYFDGVTVINNLVEFLEEPHDEEVFIIGGSQIYNVALPFANRLYITHINKEYEGDTFFPNIDFSKYRLISKKDEDELSFCIYERIE